MYKEFYFKQNVITKNKIKFQITKHEEKVAADIKADKNYRKKLGTHK